MTSVPPFAHANAAFMLVAQHGLSHVGFEAVRQAALVVWHGQDRVTFEGVHGPHLDEALYLLERLSFYNVVPKDRKKSLLSQVRQARATLLETVNVQAFEATYRKYLPDLQPLQTRHTAQLNAAQPA